MVIINSFSHPESPIRFQQRNIRVILDKKDMGSGTLFISENTLSWQHEDNIGFTVSYTDISLHAISKDENLYPKECLYVIIDGRIVMPGGNSELEQNADPDAEDDKDSDDESQSDVSEILLVPEETSDSDIIKNMYENIKVCQELNPDPNDMDDEEDDHLYEDAEDEMEEGVYEVHSERGGGDADVDELSRRIQSNSVDIRYNCTNGNDDEEFQDAD